MPRNGNGKQGFQAQKNEQKHVADTLSVFMMSNVVLLSRPVETLSNRNTVCGPQSISPGETVVDPRRLAFQRGC